MRVARRPAHAAEHPAAGRSNDGVARARRRRDPGEVVRASNLSLAGAPETWPDQIARLATEQRSEAFYLDAQDDGGDAASLVRRPGEQTAPRAGVAGL